MLDAGIWQKLNKDVFIMFSFKGCLASVTENETSLFCMSWHQQASHKRNISFHTDYSSYVVYLQNAIKGENNFRKRILYEKWI